MSQLETLIAEDRVGQVQACRHLLLIGGRLCAQRVDGSVETLKFRKVIPKGAVLRGTTPSARDLVPARRGTLARHPSARVRVDDRPSSRSVAQADLAAGGRGRLMEGTSCPTR